MYVCMYVCMEVFYLNLINIECSISADRIHTIPFTPTAVSKLRWLPTQKNISKLKKYTFKNLSIKRILINSIDMSGGKKIGFQGIHSHKY